MMVTLDTNDTTLEMDEEEDDLNSLFTDPDVNISK